MGSSRSQVKEQSVMESPASDIKEISEEAEEIALVSVFIYGKYSQKKGKEFKRG